MGPAWFLWLIPAIGAAEIHVEAQVLTDLRIEGVVSWEGLGEVTWVDPVALLPLPANDLEASWTWPGRPDSGALTWSVDEGERVIRFQCRLPERFGAMGQLERGLWANGGWFPQPLVDGEMPRVFWRADVELPPGSVGMLNGAGGEQQLHWEGEAERLSLAVLTEGRLSRLEEEGVELLLLEDGLPRPQRDAELLTLAGALRLEGEVMRAGIVEAPMYRRLVRPGAQMIYLSDKAFRVSLGLERHHRVPVAHGVLNATLPIPDAWSREIAARALSEVYADRAMAPDAVEGLGRLAWLPAADSLLYDGRTPFYGELFGESHPSDPLADDLREMVVSVTAGQVISDWIDDLFGSYSALAVTGELLEGKELSEALANQDMDPAVVMPWREVYPPARLSVRVERGDPWTVQVRREADEGSSRQPVVLLQGERRETWLARPGVDTLEWESADRPERVWLDPDRHHLLEHREEARWPPGRQAVLSTYLTQIYLNELWFAGMASATIRRPHDTRRLGQVALFTDPVNTVGVRGLYAWKWGSLVDRRRREHLVYGWGSGSLLSEEYRPTDHGQYALGAGFAWDWDTRVSWTFPTAGQNLWSSVDAGWVPATDSLWGAWRSGGMGVVSWHPRQVIATRFGLALAYGSVEHRLLDLGGLGALLSVPAGAFVGNSRAFASAEYRLVVLDKASIALPLLWLEQIQIAGGVEGGFLGYGQQPSDWQEDYQWGLGGTFGVTVVADMLGVREGMIGLSLGVPLLYEPAVDPLPTALVRWTQAY